jgi:tetratricopeptide (TPR) repeat protein
VVNVVDAVLGQGAAVNPAAPLPVPEDLAGVVETRIAKLPLDVVALLETAAVCGVEFRAGVIAAMCGLPLPEVIAACDRLVRSQFWLRHSGTLDLRDGSLDAVYAFRHAIYRHVFYQRLGAAARMQAHRNAAKALAAGEAQGVPVAPAELASHHERGREAAAAIRAYVQAVQVALRSFAPVQALELAGHARGLLAQVPPGREQLELELGIESGRGVAAAQVHGVGSAESRAIFERVRELCEQLPRHPARALLLNGYGASLYSRAEYDKLEEFAALLEQLDGPDRAPLAVMTAFFRAGESAARGRCRVATEWWLKAIGLCEAITDRRPFQAFIVDPEVGIRANSVRSLFERGLFDQARAQSRKAIELADSVGQPLAQSLAHWRAGMLEIRFEDPERVLDHALAIERIVTRTSVVQGEGPSLYLRGWALARRGDAHEGLLLIRNGLERHLRIGMIASCTEVMGYAVEALILARDWAGASEELARTFARAREIDEHAYLPALLLLQSRVARGQGDEAAGYRWLEEAWRVSREQEASGFELKAAIALVEHPAATSGHRDALRGLLTTLTEGHDSPDVLRARALIS